MGVIWFIDNKAAEAALVKAGSPTESMCRLALVATAALTSFGARPWFEWIPSDDNPADVLSRAGFDDPVVASHLDSGRWEALAPREPPAAELDFDSLFLRCASVAEKMRLPIYIYLHNLSSALGWGFQ